MIVRVDVSLEQDNDAGEHSRLTCRSVVSVDHNDEKKEFTSVFKDQVYTSKKELIEAVARELKVDKEYIDFIDDDSIRDDRDTREEDVYPDGGLYPYEIPEQVDISMMKFTIYEWLRKLKEDQLLLNSEFQRHLVWKDKQKSNFIESILLNIPVPPMYVMQNKKGEYIIVDGLQRISTLREFITDGNFKLQGLEVLKDLNGKGFRDLAHQKQTAIEDKQLDVYNIKHTVPIAMVYDIFNRINTGGTQLNRQEIRNRIFIDKATRLLKRLSEEDYFKRAIDYGISHQRMKDREVVLRYLAFKISDYKNDYKGYMDKFLEDAMKRINQMEVGEIDELETDFKRVMELTHEFFGTRNFRIPVDKSRGRINIALLESVSRFFSTRSDDFLEKNRETIKANFRKLLGDEQFINSVTRSTGDKKSVLTRFERADEILGTV